VAGRSRPAVAAVPTNRRLRAARALSARLPRAKMCPAPAGGRRRCRGPRVRPEVCRVGFSSRAAGPPEAPERDLAA